MIRDSLNLGKAKSLVTFSVYDPTTKSLSNSITNHNLVLYGGADIAAQLLAGNSEYAISTMYLEFINLADPGDVGSIVPPVFDRSATKTYYDDLVSSPDTDYLRVALAAIPTLSASSTDYNTNRITFFGVSSGTTGVHGKTFSNASNSAIYGAGLVCTPDPLDSSHDVVYARAYSGIDGILKLSGKEIAVRWVTDLT